MGEKNGKVNYNLKKYEEKLRKIKEDKDLKLPKLEIYKQILKSIDKECTKSIKKIKLLSKKRNIVVNLIFEEKDRFTQRIG
jgi:hypothetical protein